MTSKLTRNICMESSLCLFFAPGGRGGGSGGKKTPGLDLNDGACTLTYDKPQTSKHNLSTASFFAMVEALNLSATSKNNSGTECGGKPSIVIGEKSGIYWTKILDPLIGLFFFFNF